MCPPTTREHLNDLKGNNEVLRQSLARESRETRATANLSGTGTDMQRLQADADNYARKIALERERIAALDGAVADARAQILAQRKRAGGGDAGKENGDLIGKQVRMLENRLDKQLVKFNEALAANRQLRGKIDSMRQERVVFDGIYKKLERELHEKKREMSAIIEDSNKAYQDRDKAAGEMQLLKGQASKDRAEFEKEWRDLGAMIESDRRLRERARADAERAGSSQYAALAGGGSPNPNSPDGGGGSVRPGGGAANAPLGANPNVVGGARGLLLNDKGHAMLEDGGAEGNAAGGMWKGEKEAPLTVDKVRLYEESFAKIADAFGITDVEEVVSTFLEAEDKNFSLFNYVNNLNSEIEKLEFAISDTKSEIEKFKGQGVSSDTQRKQILRNLEERLQRTESKADEYSSRYDNAMRTINQLKTGIHSIFSRIGCASGSSVEEILGGVITESNMMQYLGIIEQRSSEILQMYAASQQQLGVTGVDGGGMPAQSSGAVTKFGEPPTTTKASAHTRVTVEPPSLDIAKDGDDSDDEDDERPLTRDELQRKTMRGLRKSERGGQGAPNKAAPSKKKA